MPSASVHVTKPDTSCSQTKNKLVLANIVRHGASTDQGTAQVSASKLLLLLEGRRGHREEQHRGGTILLT